MKENDRKPYLFHETKGKMKRLNLRKPERQKIRCGEAHSSAIDMDYKWVSSVDEI